MWFMKKQIPLGIDYSNLEEKIKIPIFLLHEHNCINCYYFVCITSPDQPCPCCIKIAFFQLILLQLFHRKKPAPLYDQPRSCDQADEEALTEDSLKIHI